MKQKKLLLIFLSGVFSLGTVKGQRTKRINKMGYENDYTV